MEGGKGLFLDNLGQGGKPDNLEQDGTNHFMIVWSSAFQRKVQYSQLNDYIHDVNSLQYNL